MSKKLVIIGAGGHGKVIANIAKLNGYDEIIFLDDDTSKTMCGLYPVVGTSKDINNYKLDDFIVGIGNNLIRRNITSQLLKDYYSVVTLIHPTAVVDETVQIGQGSVVMANAAINADTIIGIGCIINTSSSVDHDCIIHDFVHVCPGSHVAGSVTIGDNTWIGIGSSVINNVTITNDCMIGAGAVVVKDLIQSGIYVGVPVNKVE